MPAEQQLFLFASLDFPGRSTLNVDEVADKLGIHARQVLRLIDDGSLVAINLAGADATKRYCKIPIEAYRAFVVKQLTAPIPQASAFLSTLPKPTLRELLAEIKTLLAA